MKKLTKILSITLAFALIFSTTSIIALSATSDKYTYSISNKEAVITKVDTIISGDITIPSTLGGYPVKGIGDSAFANCNRLKTVVIPYGITSIGNGAFNNCTSLTSITIPESVTSIGNSVFYSCSRLVSVNLPEGISTIGSNLFFGCAALSDIIIPDGVTSIGEFAFSCCSLKSTFTVPECVTSIGKAAFSSCGLLKNIYILNSDCKIFDNASTFDSSVNIHGACKSTAQTYAKKYNRKYVITKHFYNKNETVATCTEQGFTTYTCDCGDSYVTDYTDATGHSHTTEITTPATHLTDGIMTYTCTCGDSYTEAIAKTTEHTYDAIITAPTCTDQGYTTYICECGDTYVADYVDTNNDHADEDADYICDNCGAEIYNDNSDKDNSDNCSHICHKSGFIGVIWKIINFLQKLFGTGKYCECGVAHY